MVHQEPPVCCHHHGRRPPGPRQSCEALSCQLAWCNVMWSTHCTISDKVLKEPLLRQVSLRVRSSPLQPDDTLPIFPTWLIKAVAMYNNLIRLRHAQLGSGRCTYCVPGGIWTQSSPALMVLFSPPITPWTSPSSSLIHSIDLGW